MLRPKFHRRPRRIETITSTTSPLSFNSILCVVKGIGDVCELSCILWAHNIDLCIVICLWRTIIDFDLTGTIPRSLICEPSCSRLCCSICPVKKLRTRWTQSSTGQAVHDRLHIFHWWFYPVWHRLHHIHDDKTFLAKDSVVTASCIWFLPYLLRQPTYHIGPFINLEWWWNQKIFWDWESTCLVLCRYTLTSFLRYFDWFMIRNQ
jgi:hypothetical protein